MNYKNNDQSQNSVTTKLIDLIKEKIWLIVGGLLSGSVLAYVLSRFFVKTYLDEIGYSSLTYSALLDNSTVSALTFGIFAIFIGFLFAFCIAPSFLRFFYFQHIDLYEEIHDENQSNIGYLVSFCLSLPLLVLIPEDKTYLLSPFFSIFFEIEPYWFMYLCFSPFLIFMYFIMKIRDKNFENVFNLIVNGFLFGGVSFLSFYPFSIFIYAVDYSNMPNWLAYIIIVALWGFYSFISGFRVTSNDNFQYFLDFGLGMVILFQIFILSSNTLRVPIAEFVGIKDKEAKIYQIPQSDYDKLNRRIQQFWRVGAICNNNDKNNEAKNCEMLVANYNNACTKECNNLVYFNAKVIFRDNKNAIICPPNYQFGKNMNSRCVLIKQNTITPTAQTTDELKNNNNLTLNSFQFLE